VWRWPRSLVKRPAVLLLDEPLGALDLKLRKAMQYELMTMQNELGITLRLRDARPGRSPERCATGIRGDGFTGVALQVGRPEEIYETPNCRFVADFNWRNELYPRQSGISGRKVRIYQH